MIDFLGDWVINIVILVIFLTFLDIILPNHNLKRYINMISGLLIIIVIINPFINLLSKDINIEREVFSNIMNSNMKNNSYEKGIEEIQNQQVINIYKESLKKEIIDLVVSKTPYSISDISLEIIEDQDKDDFGKIQSVILILSDNIEQEDGKSKEDINIRVDEVKKVTVNLDKNLSQTQFNSSKEFVEVQELISDSYRIPKDQVFIGKH